MSVTSTITTTDSSAIATQEITDATAWRCLASSERTTASLSSYSTSICRTTRAAAQLMNRAASKPPISNKATRTPRVRIHSPMEPCQKPFQRSDTENANKVLVVISSVAPPDSCLQEPVDVSVQYRSRV